jgi:hypothetical protein
MSVLTTVEETVKGIVASLPDPVTSKEIPELAEAINLAIRAARNSAESALILARLSKEIPSISKEAHLAAEVASSAATFAASVASICIDCTSKNTGERAK